MSARVRQATRVRMMEQFKAGHIREIEFTGKVYVIKMMDRLWSLIKREIISGQWRGPILDVTPWQL